MDISNEIQFKRVPLEALVPSPHNYNQHPPAQIADLKASLIRYKQVKPVVVQKAAGEEQYIILAGHGITEAAKELYIENPTRYAHLNNWSIAIAPASWSIMDVKGYIISDNETTRKADVNEDILAQLLSEQQEAGYDLASLGTDDETLRQMLASLDEDIRESMKVNQERAYEKETLDGSDRKFGTTPEQYLERYEATDIRQIVLIYDKNEYIRIMRIFDKIRKQENLETNTDVATMLLEQYAEENGLEEYDA